MSGVRLDPVTTYGSTWQPLAISRDGSVLGFCMWAVDDDASRWVGSMVVDAAAQRAGVARTALALLIERFEAEPDCPGVALSYAPENVAARELYTSLGFHETGETRTRASRSSPVGRGRPRRGRPGVLDR